MNPSNLQPPNTVKENELISIIDLYLRRRDDEGDSILVCRSDLVDFKAALQTPAVVPAEEKFPESHLSVSSQLKLAAANGDSLASLLQQMLDVAENCDETGYADGEGFIDLGKLHDKVRAALATPAVSNADDAEQPELSSRTLVTALVSYMKENGVRECGNEDFHGILLNGGPINDPRVLLAAKVAELEEKLVAVQTDDADRRRLDWLLNGGIVVVPLDSSGRKVVSKLHYSFDRAAIDAAMEVGK